MNPIDNKKPKTGFIVNVAIKPQNSPGKPEKNGIPALANKNTVQNTANNGI